MPNVIVDKSNDNENDRNTNDNNNNNSNNDCTLSSSSSTTTTTIKPQSRRRRQRTMGSSLSSCLFSNNHRRLNVAIWIIIPLLTCYYVVVVRVVPSQQRMIFSDTTAVKLDRHNNNIVTTLISSSRNESTGQENLLPSTLTEIWTLHVDPSSKCHVNTTSFDDLSSLSLDSFCQDHVQISCQVMKKTGQPWKTTIHHDDSTSRHVGVINSTTTNANGKNCTTTTHQQNKKKRKTIWVTGMSLGYKGKHDDAMIFNNKNKHLYLDVYVAALESWKVNAHDVLQPILIVMTPEPKLPSNNETTTSDSNTTTNSPPKDIQLPPFGRYVQDTYGVIVLVTHSLSFQDVVYSNHPSYEQSGAIAYYLRFDIPLMFRQTHSHKLHSALRNKIEYDTMMNCGDSNNDNDNNTTNTTNDDNVVVENGIMAEDWYDLDKVMYTDSDVLFVNPISLEEINDLKSQVESKGKFIMYGQDYLINRRKPSNTGVMIIDLDGFASKWSQILKWGQNAARNQVLPEHDQLWLNRYYASPKRWRPENVLLPPTWNWKVSWQIELPFPDEPNQYDPTTTNPPINDIKIVHFQGPKPSNGLEEIASCDFVDPTTNHENNGTTTATSVPVAYQMFVTSGMCCDRGRTARAILQLYNQWKPKQRYWELQ